MKTYFKLFLALLPLIIPLSIYFISDPYQVLYHHDSFFPKDGIQHVAVNKDYASTENLINKYGQFGYDSYIFGNSRSMYYHVDEWQKHINSSKCYHYDAYGEGLYGIERKFNFLAQRKMPIKNALIVFDMDACITTDNPNYSALKHPLITGESALSFQYSSIKSFFNADFITQYLKFLITGKIKTSPFLNQLSNTRTHYEATTNELTFPYFEELIASNRDSFYNARKDYFLERPATQQYYPQTLKADQIKLLNNIKRIMDADHTLYRIVLSPLYDQKKTTPEDLQILYNIFGKENVYDFSGINELTESKYNYYEGSHYRPLVANKIMDTIYK